MIQITHWQELIPPDFMGKFMQIEKALISAKRFDRVNQEEDNLSQRDPEAYKAWKQCKWRMRHAGFESIPAGNKILWHERGWHGTGKIVAANGQEELKFRYVANTSEKPVYISLSAMMKLRNEINQNADEEAYYKPTANIYTNALSKKYDKKPTKNADYEGFTHED
jgi:hypothetical protein